MKMKKITLSVLAIGILALSLTVGCKKNDNPTPPTKTVLITAHKWAWVQSGCNGVPSCNKDDSFLFLIDNTYKQNTNTLKCSTGEMDVIGGNWKFNKAQDSVFIDLKGADAKIIKLDTDSLIIQGPVCKLSFAKTN